MWLVIENHHPKNGGFHSHGDTPIAGWFTMQNPKIMLFRGTPIRTPSNKNSLSPSPFRMFSMGLFKLNINMLLITARNSLDQLQQLREEENQQQDENQGQHPADELERHGQVRLQKLRILLKVPWICWDQTIASPNGECSIRKINNDRQ